MINRYQLKHKKTYKRHTTPTISSSGFPGRLVEPGSDIVLPVLPEVAARDNIVVLHFLPLTDQSKQTQLKGDKGKNKKSK